jgi:hypothetical protein
MNRPAIAGELRSIEAARDLPAREREYFDELITVGEYVIAFENLCTQLYEHEIQLPDNEWRALASIGSQLQVAPHYWELLRP